MPTSPTDVYNTLRELYPSSPPTPDQVADAVEPFGISVVRQVDGPDGEINFALDDGHIYQYLPNQPLDTRWDVPASTWVDADTVQVTTDDHVRYHQPEQAPGSVAEDAQVHPTARVEPGASVASGAIVGPYAVVASGAVVAKDSIIGEGAVVGRNAIVEHGASVGRLARVGSSSHIQRESRVGQNATVESGAVTEPNERVPANARFGKNRGGAGAGRGMQIASAVDRLLSIDR